MLEQIKSISKEFLTPKQVAPVLGCMPYAINLAAKSNPQRLGFPVIMIGNRVKITKNAFIKFMEG